MAMSPCGKESVALRIDFLPGDAQLKVAPIIGGLAPDIGKSGSIL